MGRATNTELSQLAGAAESAALVVASSPAVCTEMAQTTHSSHCDYLEHEQADKLKKDDNTQYIRERGNQRRGHQSGVHTN